MDEVKVQIRFKVQTDYGEYNDALYFTEAEYPTVTKAQIDVMKQERVDTWVQAVSNPIPYKEPTLEVLKEMETEMLGKLENIQAQIAAKG